MNKNPWKLATIIMTLVLVALLIVGGVALVKHRHTAKNNSGTAPVEFTHLDIQLQNGKPVSAPSTYLVKPGTVLDFSIKSNVYGKVGVPTTPPQTITFTQSPLTFRFKASTKAGSYPLSYQANGSSDVIQIGNIVVRSAQ